MEHEAASAASHLMTCSVCEPPGSSHSSLDDFDACIASEGSILETAAHGHGRGASTERMQAAVRTLLAGVGEDPDRQGLRDTPKRVAKAWLDITTGYQQSVGGVLGEALFDVDTVSGGGGGMVMVRDIEFASTSSANLLPFHGRCHIAYLPARGVVLGLSKFARLTALFARRFQDQQEFTDLILQALVDQLSPVGTAVLVEAKHMAEGPDAPTHLTSAAQGDFANRSCSCTNEFLALLRLNGVPVSPAEGMPSAPRTVPDQIEKRNVVGRGLRRAASANAESHGPQVSRPSVRGDSAQRLQQPLAAQQQHVQRRRTPAHDDDPSAEDSLSPRAANKQALDTHMTDASPVERPTLEEMEAAANTLLTAVVPPNMRQGLEGSAAAYVQQMLASTSGYEASLDAVLGSDCFPTTHAPPSACSCPNSHASETANGLPSGSAVRALPQDDEERTPQRHALAAARGVEELHVRFASQCEHHLLPFYGTVHAAYIPQPNTPRLRVWQLKAIVAMYSRRLQIQERFTQEVAAAIETAAGAKGVLVVVEGLHMCMVARGVEKHASSTTTVAARGTLEADGATRSQLMLSLCLN
mmetsp:Transcript_18981/g.57326  ORF Transcript_18981/g.57326 Transcript_18981/m.57326 type:complete len:584 (+) Transcript_18981:338-2089(+)|eukprot:CAMPEP_0206135650 /NCGR_PEP_ID=MMETSP1473-20131121/923_1 /ASSEMBLY_ACC=CAM_ASM_001109 /TAXON_ID=1461547 /ORGANISM="Stichococcus sp, Strain RCC1054" /LENGTH=583 /DNA_ID=CAMNT_0053527645 /DNA_START=251 /DNA_END=2002 /DNA_ORIENTATION=+